MNSEKKLLVVFGAGIAVLVVGGFVSGQLEHRRETTARLAAIEAEIGTLAATASGLGQRVEALAAAENAPAAEVTALGADVAALAARIEAVGAAQAEAGSAASAAVEALGRSVEERLTALSGEVDGKIAALSALAPAGEAPAPAAEAGAEAAPAEDDAVAGLLAAAIGEAGLALAPGQSGMAGDARVVMTRRAGPDAVLRVAGLGDVTVGPDSGTAALGNGCTLGLAGFAGRTAYVAVECPAGVAAAPAAAEDADPEVARLIAAIGATGLRIAPGQTGAVGETRLFFARRDGDEGVFRVAGGEDLRVGAGPVELPGDCSVSLAGFAGRTAYLAARCAGDAPAPTEVAAAPTATDATKAVSLRVGQTATIGGERVFYSRRAGENVVLQVSGLGPVEAGPTAGVAEIGGCSVSLVGFEGGQAVLKPDC